MCYSLLSEELASVDSRSTPSRSRGPTLSSLFLKTQKKSVPCGTHRLSATLHYLALAIRSARTFFNLSILSIASKLLASRSISLCSSLSNNSLKYLIFSSLVYVVFIDPPIAKRGRS